jgi:hypothetical protein
MSSEELFSPFIAKYLLLLTMPCFFAREAFSFTLLDGFFTSDAQLYLLTNKKGLLAGLFPG